jgi:hypothetical protein
MHLILKADQEQRPSFSFSLYPVTEKLGRNKFLSLIQARFKYTTSELLQRFYRLMAEGCLRENDVACWRHWHMHIHSLF